MNEIAEKYLPIGSVVLLKGGEKKIMITLRDQEEKKQLLQYL